MGLDETVSEVGIEEEVKAKRCNRKRFEVQANQGPFMQSLHRIITLFRLTTLAYSYTKNRLSKPDDCCQVKSETPGNHSVRGGENH